MSVSSVVAIGRDFWEVEDGGFWMDGGNIKRAVLGRME